MWSIAELNRYYLKSVYQMFDKPSYNHYENAYSFSLDFALRYKKLIHLLISSYTYTYRFKKVPTSVKSQLTCLFNLFQFFSLGELL